MEKKSIWIIIASIALLSVSFATGAQQALIYAYLSDNTICNEDSTTVYYSVYPFDSTLSYNVQLISGNTVIKTLQSGSTTSAISRTVTISKSDTNVGSYTVRINAEEGSLWDREDLSLTVSQCTTSSTCGNGICNFGETPSTCPSDCGSANFCGDGSCNNGETCNTCVADCGTCPPSCTSHAYTACYGSGDNTDKYWYNSCGQREDIAQDCGESAYTGSNFCSSNDVYKSYNHKGCSNNACYSTNENKLQQDCGEDSYSSNFCSNNDVYKTFTDKGCSGGACFSNNQNQLVQDCGESGYVQNNFCSNNDVYRTYQNKGCTNNACYSNNQSILQEDCGENIYASDSDDGIIESIKGVCTSGTNNGCEGASCFSDQGSGEGTDTCLNEDILKEYYTHPFTLNRFNCENTEINCNDFDDVEIDTDDNSCEWINYGCGDGSCESGDEYSVDCDSFDNSTHDYFVSIDSCELGCFGRECCDVEIVIDYCEDEDDDSYYAINPLCPEGNDCDDSNPQVHPNANEICNNIDDNCDGQIDEDLTRTCGISNTGICRFGQETCNFGSWEGCSATFPTTETCNDHDDDCDGETDESLTRTCGISNTGICQFGQESCNFGEWEDCDAIFPTTEICVNGLDDNCNGEADESCQICVDEDDDDYYAISPNCTQGNDCDDNNSQVHPGATETCNNIDDNCNGFIDENLIRQCGISNTGICRFGQETCEAGQWEDCDAVFPWTNEICSNGLDDNCDGDVDECLDNFTVEIIANPTSGETILNVDFDAVTNGSFGEVSYYWNIIGGPTFTSKSFTYSFLDNGTYPVYLTATDQLGRVAYDTEYIYVSGKNQGPRRDRETDWIYVRNIIVDNVDLKDGKYLQITFSLENVGDHDLDDVHAVLSIPELGAHISTNFGEIKDGRKESKTVILYLPVSPYDQFHFLRVSVDAESGTLKRTVYQEIDFKNN